MRLSERLDFFFQRDAVFYDECDVVETFADAISAALRRRKEAIDNGAWINERRFDNEIEFVGSTYLIGFLFPNCSRQKAPIFQAK